jgi:hypothetical protein
MVVTKIAHGETRTGSRLERLQAYDNGPMDPWPLHRDHWSNRLGSTLPISSRGASMDRWRAKVPRWHRLGPGGTQVGRGGAYLWGQVAPPHPLAPIYGPCLSPFWTIFLPYLLHTHNSTNTSGTRWIIKQILHMLWCFTMLLGEMLMVKMGVSDHQQWPRKKE